MSVMHHSSDENRPWATPDLQLRDIQVAADPAMPPGQAELRSGGFASGRFEVAMPPYEQTSRASDAEGRWQFIGPTDVSMFQFEIPARETARAELGRWSGLLRDARYRLGLTATGRIHRPPENDATRAMDGISTDFCVYDEAWPETTPPARWTVAQLAARVAAARQSAAECLMLLDEDRDPCQGCGSFQSAWAAAHDRWL